VFSSKTVSSMASLRQIFEAASRRPKPPFWLGSGVGLVAFANKLRTPFFNVRGGRKLRKLEVSSDLKIHLGCGKKGKYFPQFINCDMTPHKNVDLIMDCGNLHRFHDQSANRIYSNAFFEHLYRDQHSNFVNECHRVLRSQGVLVTFAVPDFEEIARCYLGGVEVETGKIFDRETAYNQTHGLPESDPLCWIGQLHKSLFDRRYLMDLHQKAGFKEIRLFNYSSKTELTNHNLAILASPGPIETSTWDLVKQFAPFILGKEASSDRIKNELVWRA